MLTADTFRRGLGKGISVTWELSKIVVPVYVLVTFLKHTPALKWIAGFCEPAMRLVGLPGEASIAVVLGLFTNLYAAIGAIASLNLSPKEITIIALMLLITHSLPMETAVAQKVGVSGLFMTSVRFALSVLSGMLLNLIL
ncbi:MAG: nucleoside recognition protein [Peptococcaceae bacterium]|nr:nucleoside recognition protein [Peptococcaceae bacterium]